MDIHKGLGNKIMNRLLFDGFDNFGLQIASIHGGSLRNAIPRKCGTSNYLRFMMKLLF
jgi:dipeptidase D